MAENIFSSYTNTVREIFTETDKGIAEYLIDGNIETVWDSHDNWNGGIDYYRIIVSLNNSYRFYFHESFVDIRIHSLQLT